MVLIQNAIGGGLIIELRMIGQQSRSCIGGGMESICTVAYNHWSRNKQWPNRIDVVLFNKRHLVRLEATAKDRYLAQRRRGKKGIAIDGGSDLFSDHAARLVVIAAQCSYPCLARLV